MMSTFQRLISFVLCACMLLVLSACSESPAPVATEVPMEVSTEAPIEEVPTEAPTEIPTAEPVAEVTTPVASTAAEISDDTVIARVNGEDIRWDEIKDVYDATVEEYGYGYGYDMTLAADVDFFRSVTLEQAIMDMVLRQKGTDMGLDQMTDAELAQMNAEADEHWNMLLESYAFENGVTEENGEEAWTQALTEAEVYYHQLGGSKEALREYYKGNAFWDRITEVLIQDVVVTDEELDALYVEKVAADKEKYEHDIEGYVAYNDYVNFMADYSMLYGVVNNLEYAWYRPAGFRQVSQILLAPDPDLMVKYNDLQSRLEEQMNVDEADMLEAFEAAESVPQETDVPETEEAAVPAVTQADVDNAKADILASLSGIIDEINQKVAEGVDFNELIAEYAVDGDGEPTDEYIAAEPGRSAGYEVAPMSTQYRKEFVDAVFSLDNIGEVSAPYLSYLGVHIVKYLADVPEGSIEMTEFDREMARADLLEMKQSESYWQSINTWMEESQIEYTGAILSMEELEARDADAGENPAQEGDGHVHDGDGHTHEDCVHVHEDGTHVHEDDDHVHEEDEIPAAGAAQ